ncbi:uncharacterized protein [Lepeophtheirus salmonis]|uniref:uncharacterized protein n=1 Tax=Lepeophtheirus salmonis TaxID=72036 RepID=UPI001AEB8DB2|nr:uncharacterized protein LOC121125626 [Lepeophtheirus salmonis]
MIIKKVKKVIVVCSLHFRPDDFTYESKDRNPSRKKKKVPDGKVKKPRLKEDAVPCIYPNLPSYTSIPSTSRRSSTATSASRFEKEIERIDSASIAFFEAEKIPPFETVSSLLKEGNISLPSGFQVLQIKPKTIDIFQFREGENGLPMVERGIIIKENLSFKAFLQGCIVPTHRLNHLVKKGGILTETSQIPNILSLLKSIELEKEELLIKDALNNLEEKFKVAVLSDEKKMKLEFAMEQCNLALGARKYSPGLLGLSTVQ